MRTDNSKQRVFDRTTRLMHWLTAGLMLVVCKRLSKSGLESGNVDLHDTRWASGYA